MAASVQDGAFAWLLCAACFFNMTLIGGLVMTSGIFYIMFKESLQATDYEVSLITSINIGVLHFVTPFAGLLSDRYGIRCVSMMGALLSTTGLACGAFSMKLYQMYITYGLIAGAGLGMVGNCSAVVINPYFNKYKRLASSFVLTGFGVGSIILPPILNYLEDIYGWRGAILLLAGISLQMMVTSTLFRPIGTFHPDNAVPIQTKSMTDRKGPCKLDIRKRLRSQRNEATRILSLLKIVPFGSICLSVISFVLLKSTLLTHFGSYVLTLGFSKEDVVGLYMAIGISSTISRIMVGVLTQITKVNVAALIVSRLLVAGILTLFMPFVTALWLLYAYGVISQILMTPSNILQMVIIMEHVPASQVAVAHGMYLFLNVPGQLLGGPTAVWLYEFTGIYAHTFFLVAGLFILSGLIMVPAAYHIHREKKHKDLEGISK